MKPWSTMFREADGSVSMTRTCLLLAAVVILGTWSALCFRQGQVLDIPGGPVTVILGFCGLKYGQMKHESDGADPAPVDAPALTYPAGHGQPLLPSGIRLPLRRMFRPRRGLCARPRDGVQPRRHRPLRARSQRPGRHDDLRHRRGQSPGRRRGAPERGGAVSIYHETEWRRIAGDRLPSILALSMLDTAVNPGSGLAATWLQLAVGVTPDGQIGDRTITAAHALDTEALRAVALSIQEARAHYYRARPSQRNGHPFGSRFLPGWLNRVEMTKEAINAA